MANPTSSVCLADGRTFERFALSRVAQHLDLVDLTELDYGAYSNRVLIIYSHCSFHLFVKAHSPATSGQ